jgi:anthranilate phosphoribosyltransferase
VFDKKYVPIIADALTKLQTKRAMVVSSADGMDEISISDVTYAAFVERGNVKEFIFDPREYGFDFYPRSEILGGDANENAAITRGILSGEITGAKRDIVIINTAAALLVEGWVNSTEEGIDMAREALDNGKAIAKLEEIIRVSHEIAHEI